MDWYDLIVFLKDPLNPFSWFLETIRKKVETKGTKISHTRKKENYIC